jgi:peptidoglycan biosynthesis protein MviN/MurJ (putative lipid II flippase)
MARQRDKQPLTDTLMGALRVCVFIFGPLTAILIALARAAAARRVGKRRTRSCRHSGDGSTFIAYTMGLVGFSCEMMLNQTFYAMTNVWTPTAVGLGTTVMWIGVATLGVHLGWGLRPSRAPKPFSKSVKCLVMWFMLRRDLGDVRTRENLVFFGKVLVGSCWRRWWRGPWCRAGTGGRSAHQMDKIKILLAVTAAGMSGVIIYIALGALAGVQEVRSTLSFVGKLRKRFAR